MRHRIISKIVCIGGGAFYSNLVAVFFWILRILLRAKSSSELQILVFSEKVDSCHEVVPLFNRGALDIKAPEGG